MSELTAGDEAFHSLRINKKWRIAEDIWGFELLDQDGSALPAFDAGAHVTVVTPGGSRRNYSLSNDPAENHHYVLAVKDEPQGRGGSQSLVSNAQEGDFLMVSEPSNNFPLVQAGEYLFIAGGIGITPIVSMMRQLKRQGEKNFQLIYCTRNPETTAFLDELSGPEFAGHVTLHHDDGDPAKVYDFWPIFETPKGMHIYSCGPGPMLAEIRDMSGHWPSEAIHMEDFAADIPVHKKDDKAFSVRHADSGECIEIAADATILEALRKQGHRLPSSCESGTCGTCKSELVAGEADHRDMVLTDEEKNHFIMICVSRALSDELVLRW